MPIFVDLKGHRTPTGPALVTVDDLWPGPSLAARDGDEIGAAIISYRDRWQGHALFPPTFWDARRGEIYLRDLDVPEPPADEPPRYRLKKFGAVNGAVHEAGAQIRLDGWLNRSGSNLMSNLEPLNESARRIHAYTLKYVGGRQMHGSPFESGKLHLENPATFGKPESARPRWAGNSAA